LQETSLFSCALHRRGHQAMELLSEDVKNISLLMFIIWLSVQSVTVRTHGRSRGTHSRHVMLWLMLHIIMCCGKFVSWTCVWKPNLFNKLETLLAYVEFGKCQMLILWNYALQYFKVLCSALCFVCTQCHWLFHIEKIVLNFFCRFWHFRQRNWKPDRTNRIFVWNVFCRNLNLVAWFTS